MIILPSDHTATWTPSNDGAITGRNGTCYSASIYDGVAACEFFRLDPVKSGTFSSSRVPMVAFKSVDHLCAPVHT